MRSTTITRSIADCLESLVTNPDVLELIGDPVWYNRTRCTKVYPTYNDPPVGSTAIISFSEETHRFSVSHPDNLYFGGKHYENTGQLAMAITEMYERGGLRTVLPTCCTKEEHDIHALTLATFTKFWQRPRARAELFFTLDFDIVATGEDTLWSSGLDEVFGSVIIKVDKDFFPGKNVYGKICRLVREVLHHIGMFM